jgi:hypothetical protein
MKREPEREWEREWERERERDRNFGENQSKRTVAAPDVVRSRSRSRICYVALGSILCAAGCWDFVEPDFPEAGAPAVLQATAIVSENGAFSFDALLAPGLAIGGVQRRVLRDTLDVYNLKLGPVSVRRNGSREYAVTDTLNIADVLALPFELRGPVVEGITGPPPQVRWFGYRKADPDTITWTRGTDLLLHVRMTAGASLPAPPIRQWFLEIRGSSRSFRISADSLPPNDLRIPAAWVPESEGDTLTVFFSFHQAGRQESPAKDYIGNIAWTVLLQWFVRVL